MPYTPEQEEDYREWLKRIEKKQRITAKEIQTKKQLQAILQDFQKYPATGKQTRVLWGISKPLQLRRRLSEYTVHGLKTLIGRTRKLGGKRAGGLKGALIKELRKR